jgi:glycosyltransferase involved in cell wall biosynthesis
LNKVKTLIAIPVFNGEKGIVSSLNSCLAQTVDVHILIIDNCSTDGTVRLIKNNFSKEKKITLIQNNVNVGRVGNWNLCLDFFQTSNFIYFKFLFPGDKLPKDSVAISESVFNRHNVSVVCGLYLHVHKNGKSFQDKNDLKSGFHCFKEILNSGFYPSKITGCFNKWSFNKSYLKDYRFEEKFLGGHTFSNQIIYQNNVFFIDEVLGIFVQEFHQSFSKQNSILYNLEYLYTYHVGLELIKTYLSRFNYIKLSLTELYRFIIKYFKYFYYYRNG